MKKIYIKLLNDKSIIPIKATQGSAGYDICANIDNDYIIKSDETKKIPTGISLDLNSEELVGLICIRSGLSTKYGIILANNIGVIDSDYRGEIFVVLKNTSKKNYTIHINDRIAQLLILQLPSIKLVKIEGNLNKTIRNDKGFGSTGKNTLKKY